MKKVRLNLIYWFFLLLLPFAFTSCDRDDYRFDDEKEVPKEDPDPEISDGILQTPCAYVIVDKIEENYTTPIFTINLFYAPNMNRFYQKDSYYSERKYKLKVGDTIRAFYFSDREYHDYVYNGGKMLFKKGKNPNHRVQLFVNPEGGVLPTWDDFDLFSYEEGFSPTLKINAKFKNMLTANLLKAVKYGKLTFSEVSGITYFNNKTDCNMDLYFSDFLMGEDSSYKKWHTFGPGKHEIGNIVLRVRSNETLYPELNTLSNGQIETVINITTAGINSY